MTGQNKNCWGCVYRRSRLRGHEPRSLCGKYKTVTDQRCIDYCYRPKAIDLALRFVKRMGAGLKR